MNLDLVFPARGSQLPTDHHYPLYGCLSKIVPEFHVAAHELRFATITGEPDGDGHLRLTDHSYLRVRVPDGAIRTALPLAGKSLDVAGHPVRLGVPSVRTLTPAASVIARVVTIKNADTPTEFLTAVRAKLTALGVGGEPQLPLHLAGDRAGEPQRKVVRIKGVAIYGYSLIVSELSAADSLTLQSHGLGGRTQMGCGFFVPHRGGA